MLCVCVCVAKPSRLHPHIIIIIIVTQMEYVDTRKKKRKEKKGVKVSKDATNNSLRLVVAETDVCEAAKKRYTKGNKKSKFNIC